MRAFNIQQSLIHKLSTDFSPIGNTMWHPAVDEAPWPHLTGRHRGLGGQSGGQAKNLRGTNLHVEIERPHRPPITLELELLEHTELSIRGIG